ncbi:hypothetical protein Esti_003464 [Eimeria stiedai]
MAAPPPPEKISLAEAKDKRKHVELEALLLANHIALLRQEDAKARKKVEQLMQKWKALDETRQREKQRHENRQKQQAERAQLVLEVQRANAAQREKDRKAREDARRQDVLRVKREHALAANQRRQYEAEQHEYNIQRSQQLRKEQQHVRERRQLEQRRRLEETHLNYDPSVAAEEKKIQHADILSRSSSALIVLLLTKRGEFAARVAELECEEVALIAKLKQTHAQQRTVCQQLDAALSSTTPRPCGSRVSQPSQPNHRMRVDSSSLIKRTGAAATKHHGGKSCKRKNTLWESTEKSCFHFRSFSRPNLLLLALQTKSSSIGSDGTTRRRGPPTASKRSQARVMKTNEALEEGPPPGSLQSKPMQQEVNEG